MSQVSTEHVLVVPTERFHQVGHFDGISTEIERYLDALLVPEATSYRPRPEMEADPSFKQLIPYVIFRYTDTDGAVHLFQYTRGSGAGESRLHAKRSIGVGGHISSDDIQSPDNHSAAYEQGMRRELEEEVAIACDYDQHCVGLINDDSSPVGRVHLGVVHIFDVQSPQVSPREEDMVDAGFVPLAEMLQDLDRFESWSAICLRELFSGGN